VAPLAHAQPVTDGFSLTVHIDAIGDGLGVGVGEGLGVGVGEGLGVGVGEGLGVGVGEGLGVGVGEGLGVGVGEGLGVGVGEGLGVGDGVGFISPQPFVLYTCPFKHLHNPSSLNSAPSAHLQGIITDLNCPDSQIGISLASLSMHPFSPA
jgi:hypothetical protein